MKKLTKEITLVADDDLPLTIWFLPSGYPNKFLKVTEDPTEYSIELVTLEEAEKILEKAK